MPGDVELEYSEIFQVLDDLQTAESVPVGALGKIFTSLDKLRAGQAPSGQIAAAEQVSIAMHKLELARRRRDEETERSVLEQLKILAADWKEISVPAAEMVKHAHVSATQQQGAMITQ